MGKRTKTMIQKSRHRGPTDGAHQDKYATEAARERRSKASPPTSSDKPRRKAVKPKPALTPEARVRKAERQRDAESEQNLRSLPGGTIDERLRSAQRGLFQDQDAIQSVLTPPKEKP